MFDLIAPAFASDAAMAISDADKIKGLLIGGGILAVGGALEIYTTLANRYRARRSRDWPRVAGTIVSHKTRRPLLAAFGRIVPLVRYSYQVDGEIFEHDAVMFGGHAPVKSDAAQAVLLRYPLGATVQVIVDPDDPRIAALESAAAGGSGLLNGVVMAACGLVMFAAAALG